MSDYYKTFPAEYQEQFEIHEDAKAASGIEGPYQYDESQREFSIPQFTQAIWDAIENWEWEVENGDGLKMLAALAGIEEDYVRSVFADDDGVIRINRAYKNVWDKIDEFARSTAANS